jgi:ketosteroid isomerase-like protein
MSTGTGAEVAEVMAAAEALVNAFGRHDTAAYFDCFTPDATFCFYTAPERLGSRQAYQDTWAAWEREDGFHVVSCRSTDPQVQVLGDAAVFTHDVETEVETNAGRERVRERETIVFVRGNGGRWLAVHEHLSSALQEP